MRDYLFSKAVNEKKNHSNKEHEENHSAYKPVLISNRKQGRYSDQMGILTTQVSPVMFRSKKMEIRKNVKTERAVG
jgi:hypothetical protein